MPMPVSCTAKRKRHRVRVLGEHPDSQGDAALGRELDGVVQQVEQHLPQAVLIASEVGRQVGISLDAQRHALLLGTGAYDGGCVVDQRLQRERLRHEHDLPGLDLGEVEDVVDHRQQGAACTLHPLRVLAGCGSKFRLLQQEVGVAENAVQWCSDLVAHGSEEVTLGHVGSLRPLTRCPLT